jgi:hypothetical protein
VIGAIGWFVGSDLGRVPTAARQPHQLNVPAHASAGTGKAAIVWHRPPVVSAFDPEGDGTENDDSASLAVDRDPTTSWETALYRDSAEFGGLKSGVGLLIDLGRPRRVQLAELSLTAPGADVELHAGDVAPHQIGDLPVVARRVDAGRQDRLSPSGSVTARYWVLWLTNLPRDTGGYRVGVAELALLG